MKIFDFISFGKCNNLYKYILIYVILRIINEYLFGSTMPKNIGPDIFKFHHLFVGQLFIYIPAFIISIFLYIYEKSQIEIKKIEEKGKEKKASAILELVNNRTSLIYNRNQPKNLNVKEIIFVSILSIISKSLINNLYEIDLEGIIIWVFDLFLLANINYIIFGIPIYSHKKFAIIFIIIFGSLFKIISTFEYLYNYGYDLIYKRHIILIPIIIIIYICLTLSRFYSICKIKRLLDYRYISISKFLMIYNFWGIIVILVPSLISTFRKCPDKNKFNDIDLICLIKIKNNNNIEYYYDSFSYYFEQIWKKDKTYFLNILFIFLFMLKLILNGLVLLFAILIIKHLSPENYLCSYEIYYFLNRLLALINSIIIGENIKVNIFLFLAECANLIGIIIYLELIEIKIFNLNRNLKTNIEERSILEYNMEEIFTGDD